jgi:tRNA nucleotidyltransferase (CCA-adding enzyme)
MRTIDLDEVFAAIPADVVGLCQRLRDAGKRGWVVGGCVRDTLRGVSAKDWDVATDARPEEVKKIFSRVIPTGIKHGTVTVLLGGEPYEVTTLRGEGKYVDGRHPEQVVFLDDIEEDLARRDFTFNAIALDPLDRTLVDPFGGRDDLAAGLLRAVGTALNRFCEDGLRILRAARFAAVLECDIESETLTAMGESTAHDTLRRVSVERVHDEWLKSLAARRPSIAFEVMRRTAVLPLHAPELAACEGVPLPDDGGDEAGDLSSGTSSGVDVWSHTMAVVDGCPPDPVLRLAALLHDLGHPESPDDHARVGADRADALLQRLKFSNDDRRRVVHLIRHHHLGDPSSWTDAEVRRWLQKVTPEHFEDVLALAEANCLGRGIDPDGRVETRRRLGQRARAELASGAALTTRELEVGGKELMVELGLSPGRHIGELLDRLLDRVIEDPTLNQRERLLEIGRELVRRDVG